MIAMGRIETGGRLSQAILAGLLPNVNSYFLVQRFEREFGAEVIEGDGVGAQPV